MKIKPQEIMQRLGVDLGVSDASRIEITVDVVADTYGKATMMVEHGGTTEVFEVGSRDAVDMLDGIYVYPNSITKVFIDNENMQYQRVELSMEELKQRVTKAKRKRITR